MKTSTRIQTRVSPRIGLATRNQRGAAVVVIVIALFALVLMAGLALDMGHMFLNKARLQNAVDAAALSAAKTLDETASTSLATTSALQALGLNANASGNHELASSYNSGTLSVTVQYSSTLPPFDPGSTTGPYVRVIATGFDFAPWLVEIAGFMNLKVNATAVAGPSPTINTACNLAPMMVCGDPTQNPATDNYGSSGGGTFWGYTMNQPQVLKSASPGDGQIGPGNFQLIQLGGTGGDLVRQNLAGDYQSCLVNPSTVQTQTGNEAGPVAQGLNTRFGIYTGSMTMAQYPPDVLTSYVTPAATVDTSGNIVQGGTVITSANIGLLFDYQQYEAGESDPAAYNYQPVSNGGPGVFNRRVLSVPIGNCSGTATGTTSVNVLGFACFYILQPVTQQGTTDYIIGEFVGNCNVNGEPGPDPGDGPGPYIIELYHNPGSGDS